MKRWHAAAPAHDDWLRLLEPTGPFLTAAVLKSAFGGGLDRTSPETRVEVKAGWADMAEAAEGQDRSDWVWWFLRVALGWGDRLLVGSDVPSALAYEVAEHDVLLQPDAVLLARRPGVAEAVVRVLVMTLPTGTKPLARMGGAAWSATPVQRLALLCRAADCPLGLVTDGDLFTFVRAPRDGATGWGTWRATLFSSEPAMLDSLVSLWNLRRFQAMGEADTPEALLARSAENQSEITNTLGRQARRAVELMVNAISRGDLGSGGRLLDGVALQEVYEAAVTVLMRMVILLTAEERGLLPVEDPLYAASYAISTLKADLEEAATLLQEQLELRSSAWHRLLATSRAVHGGVMHDQLRVPAYGSRLFDPERFPFLEGRRLGEAAGSPLPVDDLSMLGILRALQELQLRGELRQLSYKHLEVEQIGHVYEGLLDHAVRRAERIVVSLAGNKSDDPEIALRDLEAMALDGGDTLALGLSELTGRSVAAIAKLRSAAVSDDLRRGLLVVCHGDKTLVDRLLPYANLLSRDLRGDPLVFLPGAIYVTETSRKRDSGTAYTTRELADEMARYALEPLVYAPGPTDSADASTWRLKSSEAILALKVCDLAIGSGAIAVAVCRYLAERLVEAWQAEGSIDGRATLGVTADDPEQLDVIVAARRLIAERCIYGVDRDPMAVDMAKLSLWLVTMAKDRPFSFLDHAIVAGDSLLGITELRQLTTFHLNPAKGLVNHHTLMGSAMAIGTAVQEAAAKRKEIEATAVVTVMDAQLDQERLQEARLLTRDLTTIADLLIGAALSAGTGAALDKRLAGSLEDVAKLMTEPDDDLRHRLTERAQTWLDTDLPTGQPSRRPMHWPLVFPEVFEREQGGFDGFVGNPPFLGGKRISGPMGTAFRSHLVEVLATGRKGNADLVTYFFLRAASLTAQGGTMGFLATNTIAQGDSREVGLDWLLGNGWCIHRAIRSRPWPGEATLEVAQVWLSRQASLPGAVLEGEAAPMITPGLTRQGRTLGSPLRLAANESQSFQGSIVLGLGFFVSPSEAVALIAKDPRNADVLFPYLNGEDLNTSPTQQASRWVINFFDWPEERAREYPDCYAIVEGHVKPERQRLDENGRFAMRQPLPEKWWVYWRARPGLYRAIADLDRVLVIAQVSKTVQPAFVSSRQVLAMMLVAFPYSDDAHFGLLASSIHVLWVVKNGSTMRTDIRYTPSDVFETFPQPSTSINTTLTAAGRALDLCRRDLMATSDEGLTQTYNRLHGKDRSPGIEQLRELHIRVDHAVAAAYGWDDLRLDHGFHPTTQGERFTISPVAQAEVLDRLLELNHARYAAEVEAGLHGKGGKGKAKGVRGRKGESGGQVGMFG